MIYTIFFILVFVAPSLWLKYTFKKNDRVLEEMPFSPRELGNTILKEFEITTVSFEETKTFDHYDRDIEKQFD